MLEHDFPEARAANGRAPTHQGQPAADLITGESTLSTSRWRRSARAFAAYREIVAGRPAGAPGPFPAHGHRDEGRRRRQRGDRSAASSCSWRARTIRCSSRSSRPGRRSSSRTPARVPYANHGQRIVVGCQLMQSASDIFLGWTEGQTGRQFYVRQLRDMKIKLLVEVFTPERHDPVCRAVRLDPGPCPRPLGRARQDQRLSRQERPVRRGRSRTFSVAYADQSERDTKSS